MKKIKFEDIFVPKYRTYLVIIFLILFFMCMIEIRTIPLAVFVFVSVLIFTYRKNVNMIDRVIKNMNSLIFKLKTDDTILDFPIPAVILTKTGDILWNNNELEMLFKGINKQRYMENLIKELEEEYDTKFKAIDKELSIHDKHFRVLGNLVNYKKSKTEKEHALMLYFIDRTEYYRLFRMYDDAKDAVGLIMIDNYDELMQGTNDTDKPQLTAIIERKLREWFAFTGGIITRLDRNRFFVIFEKKYIKVFSNSKFEILDTIKEISLSNKIPVTLSVAIVVDEGNKYEKLQSAISTMDVALGRGGDQAVIKKDGKYEFFGGKSKEIEKTTRVKSRVVAQALKDLIVESKNVIIMGHKNMDADSLGAAMGIYRIAKHNEKEAYVVFNNYGVALKDLYERLVKEDEGYTQTLIQESEILSKMTDETLVVVVDTHKKEIVDAPTVLSKANKVVVIDHHRRVTDAIENPVLTFHEVYASSASELVTEIIEYSEDKIVLPRVEAECLYAGILTDTKNFTQKTGVRTFEAAAYLKKMGIDVAAINKAFQTDVDTYVAIADVIRNCELINEKVAIAICPKGIENQVQITAQAADELLNLNGIESSFVLCEYENKIHVSGRSNGNLNVQVILEQFGGGGHMMIAGAQIEGKSIEEVKNMITDAIKETVNAKE